MHFATATALLLLTLFGTSAEAQYGVEFTAPDTFKAVALDSTAVFQVHVKNIGTVQDTFRIDFSQRNFPSSWGDQFCCNGLCYDQPFDIALNAGDTLWGVPTPTLEIYALVDPGTGWLVCSVRSLGDTTQYREIRFWCTNQTGVEGNGQGVKGSGGQGARIIPNPMREVCELRWAEASGKDVILGIYDIQGRQVRTLSSTAGLFRWDGKDALGRDLPAGTYFYVAESGGRRVSGKILRIR